MSFLRPDVQQFATYHVDTEIGTEVVPEFACGVIDLDSEPTEETWRMLLTHTEGRQIRGIERKEGWYSRLSAPGYLDCADWRGPFDSEEEAREDLAEFYDVEAEEAAPLSSYAVANDTE